MKSASADFWPYHSCYYKLMKSRRGFTIVELLIVIVVIAILAAITIVAYNGIQTRAENTKTTQAVAQYVKAIHAYAISNDTYPIEVSYPCLGTAATCGKVSGATNCLGSGLAANQSSFDTKIKSILSALPEPSTQVISCNGNFAQGAYFVKNDTGLGKTAQLMYFLRGNQTCDGIPAVITNTKTQVDDTTRCVATLPALP
jgi:prepilin-type N-terminal cleavage/methylation domain-containing protein